MEQRITHWGDRRTEALSHFTASHPQLGHTRAHKCFSCFSGAEVDGKELSRGGYSCDGVWVALGSLGRCSWALSVGGQMKAKNGISLCM